MSKHQRPASISQVTKCVKKNMHNVQINLNTLSEFEQSIKFKVHRESKQVDIETSLSSKSINEDKSTLIYKINEVINIPKKLNEYFDNILDTKYYLFGVPKTDSFFYSILYVILKDFKLKDSKIRNDYVSNIKVELEKQLPSYFRQKKLSRYGYKQHKISQNISDPSVVTEGLICFMAEYFNINLVVIDYENERYWMGKEYNDSLNEKNVILIYTNGIYLPIIHIYGDLPDNFIFKCVVNRFKIYNKLATETDLSLVEMNVATSSNAKTTPAVTATSDTVTTTVVPTPIVPTPIVPTPVVTTPVVTTPAVIVTSDTVVPTPAVTTSKKPKLKGFSGYKLGQLQDLANDSGINIYIGASFDNPKQKLKTKRQLYDELKAL